MIVLLVGDNYEPGLENVETYFFETEKEALEWYYYRVNDMILSSWRDRLCDDFYPELHKYQAPNGITLDRKFMHNIKVLAMVGTQPLSIRKVEKQNRNV